jgi:hypothetical protein
MRENQAASDLRAMADKTSGNVHWHDSAPLPRSTLSAFDFLRRPPDGPEKCLRRYYLRDAEAFDTRVQVWPCKSGGICDWQRQ